MDKLQWMRMSIACVGCEEVGRFGDVRSARWGWEVVLHVDRSLRAITGVMRVMDANLNKECARVEQVEREGSWNNRDGGALQ